MIVSQYVHSWIRTLVPFFPSISGIASPRTMKVISQKQSFQESTNIISVSFVTKKFELSRQTRFYCEVLDSNRKNW